jgi:3-oxoacyl-[acyl-carrier protein] reductase
VTTRTALVGGGSSGIGRAVAEKLVAQGTRVAITGRREGELNRAAHEIGQRYGCTVEVVVHDIADAGAAPSAWHAATNLLGDIDVLVLNAGGPPPGSVLDLTDDDWRNAFDLVVLGPLALARLALPAMAARRFGRIVFVTSNAVRQPQPGLALSTVLRTSTTSLAKMLSREHAADGVTVNCVAPGATDTARRREVLAARGDPDGRADNAATPTRRPGRPEEIAATIAFLASEESSYVNGTTLTVDGGRTETV